MDYQIKLRGFMDILLENYRKSDLNEKIFATDGNQTITLDGNLLLYLSFFTHAGIHTMKGIVSTSTDANMVFGGANSDRAKLYAEREILPYLMKLSEYGLLKEEEKPDNALELVFWEGMYHRIWTPTEEIDKFVIETGDLERIAKVVDVSKLTPI